eukprot:jgi/Botrbrau1/21030/Bobra.0144s0042.1
MGNGRPSELPSDSMGVRPWQRPERIQICTVLPVLLLLASQQTCRALYTSANASVAQAPDVESPSSSPAVAPAAGGSAELCNPFTSQAVQANAFYIRDMRSPFDASTLFVTPNMTLEYINVTQQIAGPRVLPITEEFTKAVSDVISCFYQANFNISVQLLIIRPEISVPSKTVGPASDLNELNQTLGTFNAVHVEYMLSVGLNSSLPAWGPITMDMVTALQTHMARRGYQVRFLAHVWTRLMAPIIPIVANLPSISSSGFRFQVVMTGRGLFPFNVQKQILFTEVMFHLVVGRTGLYEVTLLTIEQMAGTDTQLDNVLIDMCMAQAGGVGQLDKIIQWVFTNADQAALEGAATLGAARSGRSLLASQSAFVQAMGDAGLPIQTVQLLQMKPTHNASFANQLASVLGTHAVAPTHSNLLVILLPVVFSSLVVVLLLTVAGLFVWHRRNKHTRLDLEDGKKPRALGMEGRHSDDSAAGRPNARGVRTSTSKDLYMPSPGPHSIATYALAEHVAASSTIDGDAEKPSESLAGSEAARALTSPDSDSLMQRRSTEARGWELDPNDITICTHDDGKDWLLGKGGGGMVFKGLRCGVQDVAVKIMVKISPADLRQFHKEVAILKNLSFDKNIVQFYGACVGGPCPLLILEYMEGGDLWEAMCAHPGRLQWYHHGRKIALDVARGLHFLHHNNVRHGDLKSKNILLTGDFKTAKIGDVGMAKVMHSETTTRADGGTFAYAAPELLYNYRCDKKADIYSFGVVMWEVCTLERPVRGSMRPVKVPEEAPQEIADLIAWCMQTDPKQRPDARQAFDIIRSIQPTRATMTETDSGDLPSDDASLPSRAQSLPTTSPGDTVPNSVMAAELGIVEEAVELLNFNEVDLGHAPVQQQRVLRTHNSDEGDLELVCNNVEAIQNWLDKRQASVRRKGPTTLDRWWPTEEHHPDA